MLKKIGLDSKLVIYLRDGVFLTSYGIVNLHLSRGILWGLYFEGCYFDSYGCSPPKKLPKYLKNKHRKCISSEYQIEKNDSYCASYCLYIFYLTKVAEKDSISAVLNLYYQMIN